MESEYNEDEEFRGLKDLKHKVDKGRGFEGGDREKKVGAPQTGRNYASSRASGEGNVNIIHS